MGGDDTEFWKELGGKIPHAKIPVDDAEGDTTSRDHIYLHKYVSLLLFLLLFYCLLFCFIFTICYLFLIRVRNAKEGFQLTTEASGAIKKELLESSGCYLLDAETEVYSFFTCKLSSPLPSLLLSSNSPRLLFLISVVDIYGLARTQQSSTRMQALNLLR